MKVAIFRRRQLPLLAHGLLRPPPPDRRRRRGRPRPVAAAAAAAPRCHRRRPPGLAPDPASEAGVQEKQEQQGDPDRRSSDGGQIPGQQRGVVGSGVCPLHAGGGGRGRSGGLSRLLFSSGEGAKDFEALPPQTFSLF